MDPDRRKLRDKRNDVDTIAFILNILGVNKVIGLKFRDRFNTKWEIDSVDPFENYTTKNKKNNIGICDKCYILHCRRVNQRNNYGWTVFHILCENHKIGLVKEEPMELYGCDLVEPQI